MFPKSLSVVIINNVETALTETKDINIQHFCTVVFHNIAQFHDNKLSLPHF